MDVHAFLAGLSSAWKDGEARPTHRNKATRAHWWRTRSDPFEQTWPLLQQWLAAEPHVTGKELMRRLHRAMPEHYTTMAQLRTLQRRVKAWRTEQARQAIMRAVDVQAEDAVASSA